MRKSLICRGPTLLPVTSSDANKSAAPSWIAHTVWCIASLMVIYALSPGPVAMYVAAGELKPSVLNFYKPLEALGDRVAIVRGFYDWYVPLWY